MASLVPCFLLLLAAAALPGSAAAQPTMGMGGGQGAMSGPFQSYQPQGALIDPSPQARCREGRPLPGAPKVLKVMPAPGAMVRPGVVVVSVTFDRPMACDANLKTSHFPLPCPDGDGAVIISSDRRTLTTACVVQAGASYSMPITDFVADGGAKSERYDLAFTTSTEAPLTDARRALALERAGPAKP